MKVKSKKITNSKPIPVKEFLSDASKKEKRKKEVTSKKAMLSSSIEEYEEENENKKIKRKINQNSGSNEISLNNSHCYDKKTSSHKKRRKKLSKDPAQYKPGMLSDLLQKKKYGYLILPWETSFGENQLPSEEISGKDRTEQKSKVKINPLFDMSKRSEGRIVSTSSATYTVFIGNLPQDITVNQVKKIFKKLRSNISKIKIKSEERKKDKMLASNNHNVEIKGQYKNALVKFSSLESYEAALNLNGKLYNGHHLRITGAKNETTSDSEKSVFVGNLAVGVTDDDLWKTFENCGEIESVRVIGDKLNRKGYFGYVNFKSVESVNEALKLNATSVLNREIRVSLINKNIGSLSDSITVKRKKKKRTKPQLNTCDDGIEISCINSPEENKEKSRKSLKNRTTLERDTELEAAPKKKKKKKSIHGNRKSEIE